MHLSIHLLRFQTDALLKEQSQIPNKKHLATQKFLSFMTLRKQYGIRKIWIDILWVFDAWIILPLVRYLLISLQYTKVIYKFLWEISEIYKFTKFRAKSSVYGNQIWKQRLWCLFTANLSSIYSWKLPNIGFRTKGSKIQMSVIAWQGDTFRQKHSWGKRGKRWSTSAQKCHPVNIRLT